MVQIVIGGTARTTAPMNIKTLKHIFPSLAKAQAAGSGTEGIDALCAVISAALVRSPNENDRLTPEQVEEELLASEMQGIRDIMPQVLAENGFQPRGEAQAVEE